MKKFILIICLFLLNIIYGQNTDLIKKYKAGINWNNGLVNNNEPAVVINPLNDKNIIIATNYRLLDSSNYNLFTQKEIGIYYSNNKGENWMYTNLPVQNGYTKYTDPSLDFDASGNIYCAYLAIGDNKSGVYLNKRSNGSISWSDFPIKVVEFNNSSAVDKPYIYVNKQNNRIYVTYSENTNKIKLSWSYTNNLEFTTPVTVSESSDTECNGAIPITDRDNNVYVVYIVNPSQHTTSSIKIAKSTTLGNTFGFHKTISQFERIGYKANIYNGTATVLGPSDGKYFRVNSFPSISINNLDINDINKIYAVWAENVDIGEGSGKSAKINLSVSSDGGVNWTTKTVYSDDDTNEQFFPAISISKEGIINILYDHLDTKTFNIVYTKLLTSVDGGNEFNKTDLGNFDVNNLDVNNNFIGDYITIRTKDTTAVGVWTSGYNVRNYNPEIINAAIIPIKKSILVGNYIEDHYGGKMKVDGDTVQINSNGNHILFEPFKTHTFQIVDEIYNYNNKKYKYRNWDNENYSQNRNLYFTFTEGFVPEIKSSYKPTYPLTVNNYLEGGSGGSYDVIWTNSNIQYPNQASGSNFDAFDNKQNGDEYKIIINSLTRQAAIKN